jgi:hypothetical protein
VREERMMKRSDVWYLLTSGILFGLFLLDILLGKVALINDTKPMVAAGDVGEFLLLLGAVIFFVIEVLRLESQKSDTKKKLVNTAEEDNQ